MYDSFRQVIKRSSFLANDKKWWFRHNTQFPDTKTSSPLLRLLMGNGMLFYLCFKVIKILTKVIAQDI